MCVLGRSLGAVRAEGPLDRDRRKLLVGRPVADPAVARDLPRAIPSASRPTTHRAATRPRAGFRRRRAGEAKVGGHFFGACASTS